ncbi:unnamed protein product, partial [marine sediment metagenome]
MDESKQPGIRFKGVFLSKLKYELPKIEPKKFKYDLNFTDTYKIEDRILISTLTIQLYDRFEIELTGVFEAIEGEENLDLEHFADVNAPALLMPYAREIINNITSRTPLPQLLLPPINIIAIKNEAKNKSEKKK